MLIVCPHCTTQYNIDASAIGAMGRSVRCARCKEIWTVAAPADIETPVPAELGEPPATPDQPGDANVQAFRDALNVDSNEPAANAVIGVIGVIGETGTPQQADALTNEITAAPTSEFQAASLSEIRLPVEDSPPLVPEAGNGTLPAPQTVEIADSANSVESVPTRRRPIRDKRKQRERKRFPLTALLVVLLVASASILAFRKNIVRHVPQLASFYSAIGLPVNLRGLTFDNVTVENEVQDGVPVVAIQGNIVNTMSAPVDVPRLRFALRNSDGVEIYTWTALPSQPVLEPRETLPFRTRLASPPADANDVRVRFFARRDAVDGSR